MRMRKDHAMNNGTLAAYFCVNNKTISSRAETITRAVRGKNRSASFQVVSCQISTTSHLCPAARLSCIRTIMTALVGDAAKSTRGTERHPTAKIANVAGVDRYDTRYGGTLPCRISTST